MFQLQIFEKQGNGLVWIDVGGGCDFGAARLFGRWILDRIEGSKLRIINSLNGEMIEWIV